MKTKTTKAIHHFALNGKIFVEKRNFVETLFTPINGRTADGYFTRHKSSKHGTKVLRLFKGSGELFAVLLTNGRDADARSASLKDGKVWAMFALASNDADFLGLPTYLTSAEKEIIKSIIENAHA